MMKVTRISRFSVVMPLLLVFSTGLSVCVSQLNAQKNNPEGSTTVKVQKLTETSGPSIETTLRTAWVTETFKISEEKAQVIVQTAERNAHEHDLEPNLILGIIAKESSFKPTATSSVGAVGLMQVFPKWHPEKIQGLSKEDLFEPEINVEIGTKILVEYLAWSNGDLAKALKRYSGNARQYAERVLKYKDSIDERMATEIAQI